jgi:hypothetical protein
LAVADVVLDILLCDVRVGSTRGQCRVRIDVRRAGEVLLGRRHTRQEYAGSGNEYSETDACSHDRLLGKRDENTTDVPRDAMRNSAERTPRNYSMATFFQQLSLWVWRPSSYLGKTRLINDIS